MDFLLHALDEFVALIFDWVADLWNLDVEIVFVVHHPTYGQVDGARERADL